MNYCQGLAFSQLHQMDKAFPHLQQALVGRDVANENEDRCSRWVVSKIDILEAVYDLGLECLWLGLYQLSLDYYQLAIQGWATVQEVKETLPLISNFHAALSLYGVGDFQQGLQLLQRIEAQFLAYYIADIDYLLKFKYLVGYGTAQLRTFIPFIAKHPSPS